MILVQNKFNTGAKDYSSDSENSKEIENDLSYKIERRQIREKEVQNIFETLNYMWTADDVRWKYISGLLLDTLDFCETAPMFPRALRFAPSQNSGDNSDVWAARNFTRALDHVNNVGLLEKAQDDGLSNLAKNGECFIQEGWGIAQDAENSKRATHFQFKHAPWEEVYWEYGNTSVARLIPYTADKYQSVFGKELMDKVRPGAPFGLDVNNELFYQGGLTPNYEVYVLYYWNYGTKKFEQLHGGGSFPAKILNGEDYHWKRKNGEGYSPLRKYIYHKNVDGYHGYGPIDKLMRITKISTELKNAQLKMATDTGFKIITSANPIETERDWKNSIVNQRYGVDKPVFNRATSAGQQMRAETVRSQYDPNEGKMWTDELLAEAGRATKIDYLNLVASVQTARQASLVQAKQEDIGRGRIYTNRHTIRQLSYDTIWETRQIKSDINKHVLNADDEFTDKYATKPTVKKTYQEILDEGDELRLNVKLGIDEVDNQTKFLRSQTQADFVAKLPQDSVAAGALYEKIAFEMFPGANLSGEDFMPGSAITAIQQRKEEKQAGSEGGGGVPQAENPAGEAKMTAAIPIGA